MLDHLFYAPCLKGPPGASSNPHPFVLYSVLLTIKFNI